MSVFWKTLRVDLLRAIWTPRFLCAVVGYSLFLCINLPKNTWPSNVIYLFHLSYSYGFYIFFFLCAAVPYATSYLADTEGNYLPLILRKIPTLAYSFSRCAAVAISGMLSVILSTIIFLLYLRIRFPFLTPDYISYSGWGALIEEGKILQYLCVSTYLTAAMGGVFAVISLAVSTKIRNAFVILAIPVLLYYSLGEIATLLKTPSWLDISSLLYVPFDSNHLRISLVYVTILFLLVFLLVFDTFYQHIRRLPGCGYSE